MLQSRACGVQSWRLSISIRSSGWRQPASLRWPFVLAVRRAPARQWLALAALVVGLGVAYGLLRPTPASPEASLRLGSALGAGTPLLLELQSPY